MNKNMNNVRAGDLVTVSYRNYSFPSTFVGFTKIDTQYGGSEAAFDTLKEAKAHYRVTRNADLEKVGDHLGYGHAVYALFRDAPDENPWTAYLFKGRWTLGSSADVLRLEAREDVDTKLAKLHESLDDRGAPRDSAPLAQALDVVARSDYTEQEQECNECAGTGQYACHGPCPACDGKGAIVAVARDETGERRPVTMTINDAGSFDYRTAEGRECRASFPLYLIRVAWSRGADFESEADGFGAGEGTKGDWSAIRDSTPPAIAAMLLKSLNHLEVY